MHRKAIALCGMTLALFSAFGDIRATTPQNWNGKPDSWQMKRHQKKVEAAANGGGKVVFIGDSITHFWESNGNEQLKAYFSRGDWKMFNLGFSGDRTEHVIWRLENGELDGYEAKFVNIMIGTNNTGHFPLEKESPADTVEGVRKILALVREKQPKALVLLNAIFPRGANADDSKRLRNDQVNAEIRKLADGKDVFWLDLTEEFLDLDGTLPKSLFPDRLHPAGAGYEIWYRAVKPYVEYALSDRQGEAPREVGAPDDDAWRRAYTHFRLVVDAPGRGANCMQLSDVELYDEAGEAVPPSAFQLAFDKGLHGLKGVRRPSPDDEGPENAVDGDHDTKWLDWRGSSGATVAQREAVYLEFRFAAPVKLSGYAWYTANDFPERNPSAWRFLASNDGKNWTALDKVRGFRAVNGFKQLAARRLFAEIPRYRFKIDASAFPEKARWAEAWLKPALEAMAPAVVELLDGKGAKWNGGETTLVLTDEEGVAWTIAGSGKIWLNVDFAKSCPEEVVGACVHEFAHVVQDYQPLKGRADPYHDGPGWLCEGIADWVRWLNLEGEEGVKRANDDARQDPRHEEGYGITASFLDYVAKTCDRDFVGKLNRICREGRYDEGVWEKLTGKSRQELDEEWKLALKGVKRRSTKVVSSSEANDVLDWADPFIGSAGTGHTTPAAAYPFGMVQPGPDTGLGGWEHCSSYQYGDSRIERFSQTHLSGTGCSDFSDVAFMPFTGDIDAAAARKFRSGFDKATERATPGYYGVTLDNGVKVEATCTEHVAVYRITFDKAPARLLFDPSWGHGRVEAATIQPMQGRRVSGHVSDRRGWPDRDYYFAWEVSAKPTAVRTIAPAGKEKVAKTVYSFDDLKAGSALYLKVSLSRSSEAGARNNIAAEVPEWDFGGVLKANRDKWRSILSRVEAKGTCEQLKTLYTSVYHLCFQPNRLSDAGEKPIYSTFSCWDTYRAAGPLYTILTPEYVSAFIDSMLWHFDQNGFLPVWTLWGRDNQCMIGVHSVPMVVDAYLKGFSGVDWERAWKCVQATMTENRGRYKARYELIDKHGYYPCDVVKDESVSRLLEDCYDQYCAARFAGALGKADEARFFRDRSLNWTNVFDAATGFMRGKDSQGAWRNPFDPYKISHIAHCDYTEGNAFHWNWHVMQDPQLLVGMLGGREQALRRLEGLFNEDSNKGVGAIPDVTGLIGQYCHGNEPSHHVIYFFTLLGRRDLAARYVKEVMDTQYGIEPDGLCGNDDCGQMSAWCIFASLGFYPFNPCGGEYVLGEPQLPEVAVKVGESRVFRVVRGGGAEASYSESVKLDGADVKGGVIQHQDVMNGGTLRFE